MRTVKSNLLDPVDHLILKELQKNGRITNTELAKKVGLTPPPCLRRVRALEKAGIIRGYHADLNSKALGYGVIVFVMVSLNGQSEERIRAFERQVESWPNVTECYMLNGEIDFLLKVMAVDLQHFQTFLTTKLTSAPNVNHVKTATMIRCAKGDQVFPFN